MRLSRESVGWPWAVVSLLIMKCGWEIRSCLTARRWAFLSKLEVLG